MPNYLPESIPANSRYMIFVDGENLAIRYKNLLAEKKIREFDHVKYEEDIYVWSHCALRRHHKDIALVRSYYYTCVRGDSNKIEDIIDQLLDTGISDPRVFKKKEGRSKRVDITLATEMLSHSYSNNFEVAVLVAGDEDYVPLIQEVKRAGKQVAVWFFEEGLSKNLRRESDVYLNIDFFLGQEESRITRYFIF